MEYYLENECYCPYEIYDLTGFFYQIFKPDTECELFAEGERNDICGTFVLVTENDAEKNFQPQIILISHVDGIVRDCIRFDATEHNKTQITQFMAREIESIAIDDYENTDLLNSLLEGVDAVMIDF